MRLSFVISLVTLLLVLTLSGCGILVGNVKPVDEKSEAYGVMDLSKETPTWIKLDAQEAADPDGKVEEGERTEVSDVAFQNKVNASIISLNSACRPSFATSEQDLRSFTNLLFLGISEITLREEKEFEVQGFPALQTTINGKLPSQDAPQSDNAKGKPGKKKGELEDMMLRSVIVRRGSCVYDLMYVARPKHFVENEADFTRFISSLRLK